MSEKIIELAKKVKALAEQGTAGEKAAAEGRLKFLMDGMQKSEYRKQLEGKSHE